MRIAIILGGLAGVLLLSYFLIPRDILTNHRPAQYIKSISAKKLGSDYMKVSFALADTNERPTACSGTVSVTFLEGYVDLNARSYSDTYKFKMLHTLSYHVRASDFVSDEDGNPYYECQRIPFSEFDTKPHDHSDGKVTVQFHSDDGHSVFGSQSTLF